MAWTRRSAARGTCSCGEGGDGAGSGCQSCRSEPQRQVSDAHWRSPTARAAAARLGWTPSTATSTVTVCLTSRTYAARPCCCCRSNRDRLMSQLSIKVLRCALGSSSSSTRRWTALLCPTMPCICCSSSLGSTASWAAPHWHSPRRSWTSRRHFSTSTAPQPMIRWLSGWSCSMLPMGSRPPKSSSITSWVLRRILHYPRNITRWQRPQTWGVGRVCTPFARAGRLRGSRARSGE